MRPGFSSSSRLVRVRSEDPKITREYREDDDTVLNNLDQMVGGTAKEQQEAEAPKAGGSSSGYIDDMPEIPRTEMSDAMKEKLRREEELRAELQKQLDARSGEHEREVSRLKLASQKVMNDFQSANKELQRNWDVSQVILESLLTLC